MSRNRTQAQSNAATTAPVVTPITETVAPVVIAPKSIRQLIMTGLLTNRPRKDIAADLATYFPTSKAAEKHQKHIAWYAGTMRKSGLLPKVGATVAPVTAEQAAEIVEQAAEG